MFIYHNSDFSFQNCKFVANINLAKHLALLLFPPQNCKKKIQNCKIKLKNLYICTIFNPVASMLGVSCVFCQNVKLQTVTS